MKKSIIIIITVLILVFTILNFVTYETTSVVIEGNSIESVNLNTLSHGNIDYKSNESIYDYNEVGSIQYGKIELTTKTNMFGFKINTANRLY